MSRSLVASPYYRKASKGPVSQITVAILAAQSCRAFSPHGSFDRSTVTSCLFFPVSTKQSCTAFLVLAPYVSFSMTVISLCVLLFSWHHITRYRRVGFRPRAYSTTNTQVRATCGRLACSRGRCIPWGSTRTVTWRSRNPSVLSSAVTACPGPTSVLRTCKHSQMCGCYFRTEMVLWCAS